jgi:hypothetical protein
LLALLGPHHIFHVSGLRVKSLISMQFHVFSFVTRRIQQLSKLVTFHNITSHIAESMWVYSLCVCYNVSVPSKVKGKLLPSYCSGVGGKTTTNLGVL